MNGERGKVWYGAVAFWAVVVALLAARVMLLDVDTLRAYAGVAQSAGETSVAAQPASAELSSEQMRAVRGASF